jgi:hypothetical protein
MNKNKTRAKARGKRRVKSAPVKFVQLAVSPDVAAAEFLALDDQGRVFFYDTSEHPRRWCRLPNDHVREIK